MNKFEEQPSPDKKILGKATVESGRKLYDPEHRDFAQVVLFMGQAYDAHGGIAEDGVSCWYRCISEDYFQSEYPPLIRVDRQGNVVEALTIRGKEWSSYKKWNE